MKIGKLFGILLLSSMAGTAGAGIVNDRIALDVHNGKAVLSYRLDGQTVAAAELQVNNAVMKTVIEEKLPSGSVLKIECGDQVALRAVLHEHVLRDAAGPRLSLIPTPRGVRGPHGSRAGRGKFFYASRLASPQNHAFCAREHVLL